MVRGMRTVKRIYVTIIYKQRIKKSQEENEDLTFEILGVQKQEKELT